MKAVIQRVKYASVTVENGDRRSIEKGLMVLFCAVEGDSLDMIPKFARKVAGLRIFEDQNGKMNLSAQELGLEALVVSQFTLAANTKKGMRPSFVAAAQPDFAKQAYLCFAKELENCGIAGVKTGEFGDNMAVELLNDGPVTIIMDTAEW